MLLALTAGVLVCLSVEFIDRVLKVDDPVGAISVHGANGLWGVISVGLFADGKSNYGGAWNSVPGSVTGLFYGDGGQLVAQLIGAATLIGFVFTLSFVFNLLIDWFVGQRVSARAELEGLDIPDVLVSGHHAEVARWRKAQREQTTRERRPDLWAAHLAKQQAKGA